MFAAAYFVLMQTFWCQPAHAIIGGKDVDQKESRLASPLVAIQMSEVQEDKSIRYYKGSAFLIGPNTLLTAGHNVAYIPDVTNIVAIFSPTPCWGVNVCNETRISVVSKRVHPKFRQIQGGTEWDIALLTLSENAPAGFRHATLINNAMTLGKQSVWVAGFGTDTEDSNPPLSSYRLRKISLKAEAPPYTIGSDQKFWLDQRTGGFCGGDSGGVALVRTKNRFQAIGIPIHVTYSDGKGHCLTKGAFSDVYFFRDWIRESLQQDSK